MPQSWWTHFILACQKTRRTRSTKEDDDRSPWSLSCTWSQHLELTSKRWRYNMQLFFFLIYIPWHVHGKYNDIILPMAKLANATSYILFAPQNQKDKSSCSSFFIFPHFLIIQTQMQSLRIHCNCVLPCALHSSFISWCDGPLANVHKISYKTRHCQRLNDAIHMTLEMHAQTPLWCPSRLSTERERGAANGHHDIYTWPFPQ